LFVCPAKCLANVALLPNTKSRNISKKINKTARKSSLKIPFYIIIMVKSTLIKQSLFGFRYMYCQQVKKTNNNIYFIDVQSLWRPRWGLLLILFFFDFFVTRNSHTGPPLVREHTHGIVFAVVCSNSHNKIAPS